MSTSQSFLDFVCEQLHGIGTVRPFRMMGDAVVYVDEKPVVLVCDDTVFVKKLSCLDRFNITETGVPYKGASERYVLDPDDRELFRTVIKLAAVHTPIKVKKKK